MSLILEGSYADQLSAFRCVYRFFRHTSQSGGKSREWIEVERLNFPESINLHYEHRDESIIAGREGQKVRPGAQTN